MSGYKIEGCDIGEDRARTAWARARARPNHFFFFGITKTKHAFLKKQNALLSRVSRIATQPSKIQIRRHRRRPPAQQSELSLTRFSRTQHR
jgi:hypothetical protein